MSDATRNLLISLCSHMAYMQGQLEALHQLDDPDDHYWFRESVALRQKVADHLAALADEPAEPEGKNPTRDELWELWLRLNNELPDRPAAVAAFWEHAQINARARAALADEPPEPIPPAALPEGYIDPEHSGDDRALLQTFYSACQAEGGTADEVTLQGLRAVLARWGTSNLTQTRLSPADGEVAELVPWFSKKQKSYECFGCYDAAAKLTRAAELLERLSPPQPVPVSERLPGAEETTEDGEVWIEDPGHDYPLADTGDTDWEPHRWVLRRIGKFDAKNNLHWLPAHALPLPEVGE